MHGFWRFEPRTRQCVDELYEQVRVQVCHRLRPAPFQHFADFNFGNYARDRVVGAGLSRWGNRRLRYLSETVTSSSSLFLSSMQGPPAGTFSQFTRLYCLKTSVGELPGQPM